MELDAALQGLPAELRDAVAREWGHYVSSAREQGIDIAVLAPVIASEPCGGAGSAFVVQHCVRAPGLLADLVGSGDLERVYAASFYGECLTRSLGVIDNEAALARELRLFRSREMLRIAWRDLAGWADLQETLRDLSNLASACLDSALRCLDTWQAAEWGVATGARSGARQCLVVVGMGKLGACELNFSSDIDLIFAYPEDGETVGGARTLTNEDCFRRLAQRLIQAINAPMAEGFVFRVDMRLRPFGDSGSLVMSFDAMEEYYQSHGREWERYAWIKAAAVAGDRTAGEKLLHLLRPFVFRRYLDFGAYRSLREMKALLEEQVKRKGMEDNVKLGAGGIREIEFIGQAFQLIRGGRETELQARPIVTVLHRLVERGYLPAHAGAELDVVFHALAFDLFLDQGLHLAQRAIGAEIEIAAEDEGAQQVQQFFAGGAVARHCRRLDPGVPLPLAAVALVIRGRRGEAHHQRTAVAERTQPHVDAKDEALGHRRVDRLNETLGEAAEIIFIRECPRATHGLTVLWIGEDQVDVGGKIEFARPELAHADDDQTLPRAAARARRPAPLGRLPRMQPAAGAGGAGGGQGGKIPQGLL